MASRTDAAASAVAAPARTTLLEAVIKPYVTALVEDFETGFVNLMKIDNKTMRQVLFEKYKDETVVTFIETAGSEVTGYFEKSASEVQIF